MKNVNFSSPVDASNYTAGAGIVKGAALIGIDYVNNSYSFKLIKQDNSLNPAVNGVNVPTSAEAEAATDIRAAIAATL